MKDTYTLGVTISDSADTPNSYNFDLTNDYISLTDSTSIILIKYNAKITGVKWVVQESLTNTLGGTYPIVRRNGSTYYRQFSISGLMYLDDNIPTDMTNWNCSIKKASFSPNDTVDFWLQGENTSSIYSVLTASNFKSKELHNHVFSQLTNGNMKLCRSHILGDIMIMLTGVSFTPNMVIGPNVFEFSATATEVCETNPSNIAKYILAPDPGDTQTYTSARALLSRAEEG